MNIKANIQKFGTFLSGMIMPNIGVLIAWGVLTALFIPDGFIPNKEFANMVSPMLEFLIPILIAYSGGKIISDERGGVVGAIAVMGAIEGAVVIVDGEPTHVTMILGGMVMGPIGGFAIKYFDKWVENKIKPGLEMLVNNFSAGLIGFALALLAYVGVGPFVRSLTDILGEMVQAIMNAGLLPLANLFIEPAKILFLNNAINHGILTPLGIDQASQNGKSVLFLLEANPGPGLGVLLAFCLFGSGAAKSSAPGAAIIQFIGGIHEIYFPYVMMKPALFLSVICGGVAGTFTNVLLGSGLRAPASPGSIIAIMGMTAGGTYLGVLCGIFVACAVSFLISMIILKSDKSVSDDFLKASQTIAQNKAFSKGVQNNKAFDAKTLKEIKTIIFACDAGMGSSAMGASILRDKIQKASLDYKVINLAISKLIDDPNSLIVTQEQLLDRVKAKTPTAEHIAVKDFLSTPKYGEIIEKLKE